MSWGSFLAPFTTVHMGALHFLLPFLQNSSRIWSYWVHDHFSPSFLLALAPKCKLDMLWQRLFGWACQVLKAGETQRLRNPPDLRCEVGLWAAQELHCLNGFAGQHKQKGGHWRALGTSTVSRQLGVVMRRSVVFNYWD